MKSIPNKFSFYHAGTTQRYDMELFFLGWKCTSPDTDSQSHSYYTESEIRQHIADGDWWLIPKEPEMALPIDFKFKDVEVKYTYYESDGDMYLKTNKGWKSPPNWVSQEVAKERIKDGTWIVTSVGKQPYELSEAEGSYNPPEAPTNLSKDISHLTIKVNSDGVEEAVKAAKELSDVVDSVNAGLERMNELLGQIGGARKEYAVEITNRPDFNFEEF
jgi:hypothetical protein